MDITAQMVKDLREKTGVGMMDCKKALVATNGDVEKAIDYLREQGIAKAVKKQSRVASEGIVDSYIHMGGKIGVLVEVNCESDFVAKSENFLTFVHDVALQIAASNPLYVSEDQVPAEEIAKESEVLRQKAINEGKPEKILDKIVEGGIKKYYTEVCLLDQAFVKDPAKTISAYMTETVAKTGEKISIRRFVRYEMGEGLEKKSSNLADEVSEMIGKKE